MTGAFKEQETANSNWLPVRENKVPEPRPGSCSQVHQSGQAPALRYTSQARLLLSGTPVRPGSCSQVHPEIYQRLPTTIETDTLE
jgi:hypothetical protein